MDDVQEFLEMTVKAQAEAGHALHDGDPGPWTALWSTSEPVTVFGAIGVNASGRPALDALFPALAARFRDSQRFDIEVVAAGVSGDLAYLATFEDSAASFDGGPVLPIRLRVTQVYRREDGEWRIVHRHGERDPQSGAGQPGGSR